MGQNDHRARCFRSISILSVMVLPIFGPTACLDQELGAEDDTDTGDIGDTGDTGDTGDEIDVRAFSRDELEEAAQQHLSPQEVAADIRLKGPYSHRPFARRVGAEPTATASAPASRVEVPGTFIVDPETRETNEVVILLDYRNVVRLGQIVPATTASSSPLSVERALMSAVSVRAPLADFALGGAVHLRPALENRMADTDRAASIRRSQELVSRGLPPDPRETLQQYLIARYPSVALARLAAERMQKDPAFASVGNNRVGVFSAYVPNDSYFSPVATPSQYQWGIHMMKFPAAWQVATGQSFIGIVDRGWPGYAPHPGVANATTTLTVAGDLAKSFRQHMISRPLWPNNTGGAENHTLHVAGIIAATHDNGKRAGAVFGPGLSDSSGGVAGGCFECSFVTYPYDLYYDYITPNPAYTAPVAIAAASVTDAVEGGMQVINWSGNFRPPTNCMNAAIICTALELARTRSVLVVVSAANFNETAPDFPANLDEGFSVLPVGSIGPDGLRWDRGLAPGTAESGSNYASSHGVVAPGVDIPSTFTAGAIYNADLHCGSLNLATDLSAARYANGVADEVGTCTGSSMAAPHVAALAGMIRSVDPRMTYDTLRDRIRESSSLAGAPNEEYGYGVPNAQVAIKSALLANPTHLTPLLSYYSANRQDSLYTTVPQIARSAAFGRLLPRVAGSTDMDNAYTAAYGGWINGYSLPHHAAVFGGDATMEARAQVWIFTTPTNPNPAGPPLRAIYRMSWRCGDQTPIPPAVCADSPNHVDSVLVGKDELAYFGTRLGGLGYRVDGLEGYVYPPGILQPPGTVRLMRKYNATRDDHACFPDTESVAMAADGYTSTTNMSDWLGYVYPNTGGIPVIP